jgi:nucleoside transporter
VIVLSTMYFLQHAVLGAWVPLLQLHLRDLGFSGTQIGSVYATLAIASIFAPWLAGQLADRVMPAQRVMLVSHLCSSVLLWWAATQTRYESVLILLLLNAMLYMPSLGLANLIVFRHLADRDREFGHVRLWGTASWIVVALALGLWLEKPAWLPGADRAGPVDGLRLAAVLSAAFAVFCLVLPATPPERIPGRSRVAALGALRLLRDRSSAVLMLVSFLLALGMPFCYPFGSLFLKSMGVPRAGIAPLLALGQAGEIVAFFLLALCVRRFGFKTTFLIGVASWAVRFAIWSCGGPWPLVVASLALHGSCYAFVIGLGQMFVDQRAGSDTRASAQGVHQVITFGLGSWLGNMLAGAAHDFFQRELPDGTIVVDFAQFYLWPALGAAVCFLIFAAFFKKTTPTEARPVPPPDLPM